MRARLIERLRRYVWWGVFLLPVLFYLSRMDGFVFLRGAEYSDLVISHFPLAVFIQDAVREYGQVPLWSDLYLSGFPLAANPLASLFYPFHWLALLLPLPLGLNITAVMHILFGGVGMYLLLRQEGVGRAAGVMGALSFEAMPKLATHWAAGHLTLVYAVAWTPWLLLADRKSNQGRPFWRVLPGVVLGMIFLADPRWVIPAGLLWFGYRFFRFRWQGWKDVAQKFGWAAVCAVLGLGVSAVLLLPLVEYSSRSTRSLMETTDMLSFSLPLERLLGLVIPDAGSSVEWVVYPGAIVLGGALFAIWLPEVRRKAGFWLGAAALALLYALGEALPWMPWVVNLPGFNMIRVPARMIFITAMGLAATLAWVTQILMDARGNGIPLGKWNPRLILAGLMLIVLGLGGAVWAASGEFPWRFIWGGAALLSALIWFGQGLKGKTGLGWVSIGIVLLALDLIGTNASGSEIRQKDTITEAKTLIQTIGIKDDLGLFRVYSPSYSVPQHVAALNGVSLADGVDPLQLIVYANYFEQASGVASTGYSVTLPPFGDGEPGEANRAAKPDVRLLGLLNVEFVASEFDLNVNGLERVGRSGETRVYRNNFVYPRAWVQEVDAPLGEKMLREARVNVTPNRIEAVAEGPGLLVFSELAYPGWILRVDGKAAKLETVGGLLRGAHLEPGVHSVEMVYRPASVMVGGGISLLSLIGVGGLWLWRRQ